MSVWISIRLASCSVERVYEVGRVLVLEGGIEKKIVYVGEVIGLFTYDT